MDIIPQFKRCGSCKETKPSTEFYKLKTSKDGLCFECKLCESLRRKRLYAVRLQQRHLDTRTELQCVKCNIIQPIDNFQLTPAIKHGRSNICKSCQRIWTKQHYSPIDKRVSRMLQNVKRRAKELNLKFTLTVNDIDIPKFCPVIGIPIEIDAINRDNWPSIDRIIPSLGYVKENIIVVSYRANRIKNDATINELELIAAFYNQLHLKG